MSLATFLLRGNNSSKQNTAIDAELDALFLSQTTPGFTSNGHLATEKKRKKKGRAVDPLTDEPNSKRSKPSPGLDAASSSVSPAGESKKSGMNRVMAAPKLVSENGIVDVGQSKNLESFPSDKSGSESSGDDEEHPSTLVHETLEKDKSSRPANKKAMYAPADETKETRDARTIFIGNLAPDVAVKRPLKKQLHRHILTHVPTAKIESTRFRSVAFQTPTSKLPEANDEDKKEPRQHERDRASSWRDAHADEPKAHEKKFLTPSQKKKIAFINGNIHSDAGAVHAYIVFAYPTPHARPSNLPPVPPVMDPFEAARLAIEKCNGTMFLDRMLRVDAVAKKSNSILPNAFIEDPKLTVFVGNLDFASKEEDLRVFFEGIVSAERGPPDAAGSQDGDTSKHWVIRVRMIRDKDTQLGKGFAYVLFSDRTCVDEILALEPGKLKFAKRKLRVQRCKSASSAAPAKHESVYPSKKPVQTSTRAPVPPVPKGDPSLGDKLVKLSKEERKRVKAADADRVARRVAKKKARLALAKQGIPLDNQHKRRDRERVRKTGAAKKVGGEPPKKTSKGRVRSEKSIAKRNTKK